MRLFIAFDISKEAEAELKKAQDTIRKTDPNVGFVKNFHLTLKFLGEADEKAAAMIRQSLAKIRFPKFTAELKGTGVFPSEKQIKVIWAGLEPKDTIIELQQEIEERLEGLFPRDERFHPHLTLARVKFVKDNKALLDNLKKMKLENVKFAVDSFKLIKSTLTPEGPVYQELFSVELF